MHYTITRPGDSWLSLARAYYGADLDHSLIEQLIALNQPGFAKGLSAKSTSAQSGYDIFSPLPLNQVIWLPQRYCSIPYYYQAIRNTLNSGSPKSKPNLALMESAGIRPQYAVAAATVTSQIQRQFNIEKRDAELDQGLSFTAAVSPTLDKASEQTLDAVKHLKNLQAAMRFFDASPDYTAEIHPFYSQASKSLNEAVARVFFQHTHFSLDKSLRRADAQAAFGRGFSILDETDAKRMLFTAAALRHISLGLNRLDIAFRLGKVFDVYAQGGNWAKEAVTQTGGYGLGHLSANLGYGAVKAIVKSLPKTPVVAQATGLTLEAAEGVALVAIGPELVAILVATIAGYAGEEIWKRMINKIDRI